MILLLGATGYIGQAFATELRRRKHLFIPLTRKAVDYTNFNILFDYVRQSKPDFLINAAGYTGSPTVDACEIARAETLQGNAVFPQMVARVCLMTNTPWAHISSGCIYCGAKVIENGIPHVERDLSQHRLQQLFANHPERFYGFTELDDPNFSFHAPPCSFYSGTKALAEESLRDFGQCYIWRLRIPFDEFDHVRNYLSKIQNYPKVYDNINSLSHRGDFVRACIDLWQQRALFGTYNVTNPGAVTARYVVDQIKGILKTDRRFHFWKDDTDFYRYAAKAPRSNCILDVSKLLNTGVKIRPVEEALDDALRRWQPAPESLRTHAALDETIQVDFTQGPSRYAEAR
jgi:dTDP-4-dehydrorhamnose reductase